MTDGCNHCNGHKTISVPYGNRVLDVVVPVRNLVDVLVPGESIPPQRADLIELVETALDNPIGSARVEDMVSVGQKVVIISDDITRPTPTREVLEAVLRRLGGTGIPDSDISIVMALGSHRFMTDAEMLTKVGPDITKRFELHNSQFKDRSFQIKLGEADDGTEIWIDKRVVSADFRIGIGSILPHPAVGWSGGGKIVYPGVAGLDTVAKFHLMHGRAQQNMFGMDECPVRLTMERWVEFLGLDFIVNTVVKPDEELHAVVAGHYVAAHRQGVEYAKEVFGVLRNDRVDAVIASGYPTDHDFWQATKAVLAGETTVRDGGILILLAPCEEGAGPHDGYLADIGASSVNELLEPASEYTPEEALSASVAATLVRIRNRIALGLVSSGLDREDASAAGFVYFDDVADAVDYCISTYGPDCKISVMPFGSETVVLD